MPFYYEHDYKKAKRRLLILVVFTILHLIYAATHCNRKVCHYNEKSDPVHNVVHPVTGDLDREMAVHASPVFFFNVLMKQTTPHQIAVAPCVSDGNEFFSSTQKIQLTQKNKHTFFQQTY
jgi:hypothetical protein